MSEPYGEIEVIVRYPGLVKKIVFPKVSDVRLMSDRMMDPRNILWGHDRVVSATSRNDVEVELTFTAFYDEKKGHIFTEVKT